MTELNIVYSDQIEPSILTYENNVGKVWMSKAYKQDMPNIIMNISSFSATHHKNHDSLFILEPICVMPTNYTINPDKFKYIFTWATKAFEQTPLKNKTIYTNFPSYKHNPQIKETPSWNERNNEVVFIANNKFSFHSSELYSLRWKLADWLHANSNLAVSWYGNMPIRKPYFKGNITNKYEVLSKAKFSVCIENSYDSIYSANFLTEKLPDVWFSGAVPIYMGCSNMEELNINNNCYIDMLTFRNNFGALNNKLLSFSKDDYNGLIASTKNIQNIHELTSYENVCKIMIDAYSNSPK